MNKALIEQFKLDDSKYQMYLQSIEMRKQQGINLLEIDLKNIDEGMEIGTAIHPLTGEQIPVFITSYVRDDYGSGAVMGVPAHCD